jgi:hypothetical protein
MRMFGEQLEDFEPGEINVVVFAGGHKMGVNPLRHNALSSS